MALAESSIFSVDWVYLCLLRPWPLKGGEQQHGHLAHTSIYGYMFWISKMALVVIAALLVIGSLLWVWQRRTNLGVLPITTSSVAFDQAAYGHIITWDKHRFYLHGKPIMLISGEFHYWRLPDRDRWEPMLAQYKTAGLNCTRIYFHWGYHSPAEGKYVFDGNRDLEYLLQLCEKLHLYVLVAPGPYICAETQGGGIPQWLVAKRDVRIRHSSMSLLRTYDPEYSKYCAEWFNAILPIFEKHQVTTNPQGCILALQIENENFELLKGIPLGLADDMRFLAKVSREAGMTVPLFTNDGWEEGSFVAQKDSHRSAGRPTFGIDIYGFDKYVVFCPTSTPLASLGGSIQRDPGSWEEWPTSDVVKALDNTEATVRSFGGGAETSPLFIPELQGGWFNHYTVPHTFDHVYNFYGETYTRLIFDSVLSQGITALNFYMFYGGTNWGTIGDPDVYSSYDYSACVREFGHFSGRGRQLRLAISFARSFGDLISQTESRAVLSGKSLIEVKSSVSDFISNQRRSAGLDCVDFVYFRNFNQDRITAATITVTLGGHSPVILNAHLPYKRSFVGLGNYKTTVAGVHLLLATVPIYARLRPDENTEVWIIQCDGEINGELAFFGSVVSHGTLSPQVSHDDGVTVISLRESSGWARITEYNHSNSTKSLYLVSLTGRDLYSFQPHFEDSYWQNIGSTRTHTDDLHESNTFLPLVASWGVYNAQLDMNSRNLKLEQEASDTDLFIISASSLGLFGEGSPPPADSVFFGMHFITHHKLKPALGLAEICTEPPTMSFANPVTRQVNFECMPWKPLRLRLGYTSTPVLDVIDFGFTSGHVLYRLSFSLNKIPDHGICLSVNLRHRGTVYINRTLLGGHLTYSLAIFRPGSKNGPDADFGAWHSYSIPSNLLVNGINYIYVLVESFGMNRQPFVLNDIRSPRGIIGAEITDVLPESGYSEKALPLLKWIAGGCRKSAYAISWDICGVDVRSLDNVFSHSGLFDEEVDDQVSHLPEHYTPVNLFSLDRDYSSAKDDLATEIGRNAFVFGQASVNRNGLPHTAWPSWFKANFDLSRTIQRFLQHASARLPLRMHLSGPGTAYIYVNSVFIARYYGNGDGPQKDFYVPEGLVKPLNNTLKLLVYCHDVDYNKKEDDCGNDWVRVEFRLWKMVQQPLDSLATSSGNLNENGKEFVLEQTTLNI
ncbi:hypothetical protein BASA60_002578 [Batrachochytrium salamandrivorans]|nr:hypothetical protein BASA60_002578 [Batrachochytrium salamandrivorans]